jgi:hypothetical protein
MDSVHYVLNKLNPKKYAELGLAPRRNSSRESVRICALINDTRLVDAQLERRPNRRKAVDVDR